MSTPSPGEAALTRAPIPYSTSPAVKQRLRPQRSVSLLAGIMRTAMISRNSVIAACTPVTVVFRSSLMSLIITFMFEPAKLQMNWASASGTSTRRRALAVVPDEAVIWPPSRPGQPVTSSATGDWHAREQGCWENGTYGSEQDEDQGGRRLPLRAWTQLRRVLRTGPPRRGARHRGGAHALA